MATTSLYPHANGFRAYSVGGATIDKTRFAFFGEADESQNTASTFYDQSGNGRHFTEPTADYQPILQTDSDGHKRFLMAEGNLVKSWASAIVLPDGPLTVYALYHFINTSDEARLYDAGNHNLILGLGNSGTGLFYNGNVGPFGSTGHPIAAGSQFVTWNLAPGSGRVYTNTNLLYSGDFATIAIANGRLGSDFGANQYGRTYGYLYAWALVAGSDSAAQMAEVSAYFKKKYGLTTF